MHSLRPLLESRSAATTWGSHQASTLPISNVGIPALFARFSAGKARHFRHFFRWSAQKVTETDVHPARYTTGRYFQRKDHFWRDSRRDAAAFFPTPGPMTSLCAVGHSVFHLAAAVCWLTHSDREAVLISSQ
jgi:hypothetical protein